eukprot:1195502-Prorocentrum_minimum.AAC.5
MGAWEVKQQLMLNNPGEEEEYPALSVSDGWARCMHHDEQLGPGAPRPQRHVAATGLYGLASSPGVTPRPPLGHSEEVRGNEKAPGVLVHTHSLTTRCCWTNGIDGAEAGRLMDILECGSQVEQEMLDAAKRLQLKPAQAFEALSSKAYLNWQFS